MKRLFRFLFFSTIELLLASFLLYVSYFLRFGGSIPSEHLSAFYSIFWIFGLGYWFFMLIFGVYGSPRLLDIHIFRKILMSSVFHTILGFVLILFYSMYSSHKILLSRWVFIIYILILIFIDLLFRTLFSSFSEYITRRSSGKDSVLLFPGKGFNEVEAVRLQKLFKNDFSIKLFHEEDLYNLPSIKGSSENLLDIIERQSITQILFYNPESQDYITAIINRTLGLELDYWIYPEHLTLVSNGYKLLPVESYPFFQLITSPIYGINAFLKRLFDFILSLILIILSFPLFLIIPILVKIDSKGSVFFTQIRLGLNGQPFKIIKFRSMFEGAESETGPKWADKDDDRITRIGRFLRRFSLDELPQLFLVLIGKLSLIGPRPERPYFVEHHPAYKGIRLLVKPGLTGLAQINGRYELSLEEKLNFDLFYINNYSIWLDFEIFFKSIFIIIFQRGAR